MKIDFLNEDAFWAAHESFVQTASENDSKVYDDWLRYHQAIVEVAMHFGEVTEDYRGGGDFYHGGDWFTSLSDGFALRTATPLKKMRFTLFQQVVADHSPFALLSFGGEMDSPTEGLEILIHSNAILAWWRGKTREECRKHLNSLGYTDEEV